MLHAIRLQALLSRLDDKIVLIRASIAPDLPINSFGYLAWSKDSAFVYFDATLSKDNGYYRLRLKDRFRGLG